MHEKIVKYATKNVFEIPKLKTSNVVNNFHRNKCKL